VKNMFWKLTLRLSLGVAASATAAGDLRNELSSQPDATQLSAFPIAEATTDVEAEAALGHFRFRPRPKPFPFIRWPPGGDVVVNREVCLPPPACRLPDRRGIICAAVCYPR
jgi:hypothetical protein